MRVSRGGGRYFRGFQSIFSNTDGLGVSLAGRATGRDIFWSVTLFQPLEGSLFLYIYIEYSVYLSSVGLGS